MRGKVDLQVIACIFLGITPAYAGKSPGQTGGSQWVRGHPRVCREKGQSTLDQTYTTGSPPRVRGKAKPSGLGSLERGITPAYAGKRCSARTPTFRTWDHPRMCGEKLSTTSTDIHPAGSPPRVRGKGQGFQVCKVARGITPAYAGKSKTSAVGCPGCRDHPCVCGEKLEALANLAYMMGSPPRMRGKDPDPCIPTWQEGITPAYAGKRWPRSSGPASTRDHPRVCGEKSSWYDSISS